MKSRKQEAYSKDEPVWIKTMVEDDDQISGFVLRHSNWCNFNWDRKDYKQNTLNHIKTNKKLFKLISGVNHDSEGFRTIGAFCRMHELGCPLSDKIITKIENTLKHLATQKQETQAIEPVKTSIQSRMGDRLNEMMQTLEERSDRFIECLSTQTNCPFNPEAWFKQVEMKTVYVPALLNMFEPRLKEIELAMSGSDLDLKEGYSWLSKPNLRRFAEFHREMITALQNLSNNKTRKIRKKKVKTPQKLVEKLKYQKNNTELGITSTNASNIVNSKIIILYNEKYKKVSIYHQLDARGLTIKGQTIQNWDSDKSQTKSLKSPKNMLQSMTGTEKVVLNAFERIGKKPTKVTGRINENTLIINCLK